MEDVKPGFPPKVPSTASTAKSTRLQAELTSCCALSLSLCLSEMEDNSVTVATPFSEHRLGVRHSADFCSHFTWSPYAQGMLLLPVRGRAGWNFNLDLPDGPHTYLSLGPGEGGLWWGFCCPVSRPLCARPLLAAPAALP